MDASALIDDQFNRAVEIVQGLPKQGPIQTGYEEKLTMYSLYKQATVGNVIGQRPGMFDMLGRAKWDAWDKHKDIDQHEAKWMYVEALLKVLRKYSDKTIAKDLVKELESYREHVSLSRKSQTSESSGSTVSEETPLAYNNLVRNPEDSSRFNEQAGEPDTESSDDESEDDSRLPSMSSEQTRFRPQSSVSSHRYRTPLPASKLVSPPPVQPTHIIPLEQPLPNFQTPSAFAEESSFHPESSRAMQPMVQSFPMRYMPPRPASRQSLEGAVENIQAHLAALNERIDTFEARLNHSNQRNRGDPLAWSGRQTIIDWDIDDLGMWSNILNNPLSRVLSKLVLFFIRKENRSPMLIVIRRLCLDISFMLCVLAVARALWKRSGVRRREVRAALIILGRAIVGR